MLRFMNFYDQEQDKFFCFRQNRSHKLSRLCFNSFIEIPVIANKNSHYMLFLLMWGDNVVCFIVLPKLIHKMKKN